MCCRHHRDRFPGHVDAVLKAGLVDGWKAVLDVVGAFVSDVEEDAVIAMFFHLIVDCPGDDISRGQIFELVIVRHEGVAVTPLKYRSLTAHGFGNQERLGVRVIEGGRVELHEFHVDDSCAGPPTDRQSVASGDIRIAGVKINFAGTASCQYRESGAESDDLIIFDVENVSAEAAVSFQRFFYDFPLGDQVDSDMMLIEGDVRMLKCCFDQSPFNFSPGGIFRVQNAPMAVSAFTG